jgi:hypothetical protein
MGQPKILLAVALLLLCEVASAQDLDQFHPRHRFWDTTNKALFLSHAALETVDFGVTHRNLSNGGQEVDPMARALCQSGTAGQVAFFGGRTAAVVAISYVLHRTGHHRLERLFPSYASGDSAYGVAYSFSHEGDAKQARARATSK